MQKTRIDRKDCLSIRARLNLRSRFMKGGCVQWTGTKSRGYGVLNLWMGKNRNYLAHRLSYEIANGPILDKSHVLHKCDNTWCINPVHLFLGSQQDNMRDMAEKGRAHKKKLKPDRVYEIRHLASHAVPDKYIAKMFKITPKTVRDIRVGNTWNHLK